MKKSNKNKDFIEYVVSDVFSNIDSIKYRPMFGGYGIYKNGLFFSIVSDNKVFFKVDESNKNDFISFGSEPFKYRRKDKMVTLSYWELPVDILENKEEAAKWVDKSCQAFQNSKNIQNI